MKATRRTLLALVGAMAVGAAVAAPSVEITSVQQQYPWTNTVDIVYTVAGVESETNGYFVVFTPTTSDGKDILDVNGQKSVQVALKGSGVYSTQWYPQTNQQYTACKMTPTVFRGAAKDYLIVDLDSGDYWYEPMATQAASNERYNTDEYKTSKMVFRRIPLAAGTQCTIGGPEDVDGGEGLNPTHTTVIPGEYYMGIFTVTESQYARLINNDKTNTSKMPKVNVSYNTVRGSALPQAVPASPSCICGAMAAKTGLAGFDLPTEAMWEVAARAGITTKYITGSTPTGLDKYAWRLGVGVHEVGLLTPNAWGLYDTIGNVWEHCRDAASRNATAEEVAAAQANAFNVPTSGTKAAARGGESVREDDRHCFAYRIIRTRNTNYYTWGLRLSFRPE